MKHPVGISDVQNTWILKMKHPVGISDVQNTWTLKMKTFRFHVNINEPDFIYYVSKANGNCVSKANGNLDNYQVIGYNTLIVILSGFVRISVTLKSNNRI